MATVTSCEIQEFDGWFKRVHDLGRVHTGVQVDHTRATETYLKVYRFLSCSGTHSRRDKTIPASLKIPRF